jgi:LytS/YehU family sensor histidine kinase
MRALAMLFGLALCGLSTGARPRLSSWRRRVIVLALMAPVCAESFAWVNFFAEMAADPSLNLSALSWAGVVRTISFWTWFFLAWAGLYLALSYSFDVQAEQIRSAELQARAHAAQLRALHSQINPHFLFNSLNSVSALILDGEAAKADSMVSKLSHFLRMGLSIDPSATIPLASEIALQRAYLEIEQLRYPDLDVEVELPAELEDALVPSLILQPIVVENAVKYGVAGSLPPSRIAIRANWESDGEAGEGRLAIEVTDSGGSANKPIPPGAGIGLRNVGERLQLLYGARQSLDKGPSEDGGYQVRLTLPVERL